MTEEEIIKEMPNAQDWFVNVYGASADGDEAFTSEEALEIIEEYQRTVEKPLRDLINKLSPPDLKEKGV